MYGIVYTRWLSQEADGVDSDASSPIAPGDTRNRFLLQLLPGRAEGCSPDYGLARPTETASPMSAEVGQSPETAHYPGPESRNRSASSYRARRKMFDFDVPPPLPEVFCNQASVAVMGPVLAA